MTSNDDKILLTEEEFKNYLANKCTFISLNELSQICNTNIDFFREKLLQMGLKEWQIEQYVYAYPNDRNKDMITFEKWSNSIPNLI